MKKIHKKIALTISAGLIGLLLSGCANEKEYANSNSMPKIAQESHHHLRKGTNHFNKTSWNKHNYHQNYAPDPNNKHSEQHVSLNNHYTKPFKYQNGRKKFVMSSLDHLGRAHTSHIQLRMSQLPTKKRGQYITVKPSGWHNYKFRTIYDDQTIDTWMFNRGHLVGYQFCGLNNEPKNLITETAYMNQGSLHGMDSSNSYGMLMYENTLKRYLLSHPHNSLDYSVRPVYRTKHDLVPESVVLTFVGYRPNGKRDKILVDYGRQKYSHKIAYVTLPNTSPQAEINFRTGTAKVYNANGSLASRGN